MWVRSIQSNGAASYPFSRLTVEQKGKEDTCMTSSRQAKHLKTAMRRKNKKTNKMVIVLVMTRMQ